MAVARSAEEAFEQVVRQALARAWGAALDASTSEDFRDDEGNLDEEKYLRYQSRTMEHLTWRILAAHRRAEQSTRVATFSAPESTGSVET